MKLKRLGTACLASVMALAMSVPAFAADEPPKDASGNPIKDVTGTYTGESTGEAVYSYSYAFGSMKFNYKAAGTNKGTWDPKTHEYTGGGGTAAGGWTMEDANANKISVTNHSNAPVRVQLSFESKKEGIKFGFSENNFTIASAEGTTVDAAPKKEVTAGPTSDCGGLAAGETNVVLGTITLRVVGV